MGIVSEIKGNRDNKWYLDHEKIASCWQKIADDLGGKAGGIYNLYLVKFRIEIRYNIGLLKISGIKSQQNVTSGFSTTPRPYYQVLELKLKTSQNKAKLLIYKQNFWNVLAYSTSFFKFKKKIGNFIIKCNEPEAALLQMAENICNLSAFSKIEIKDQECYLKVFNVTGDPKEGNKIIENFINLIEIKVPNIVYK